jgi:epidermal growth factor receptor substrate 15
MSGQLSFVPTSLPPGLYEQAGGGKGPDGGVATHNTGSSGFSSPGINGSFPGRSVSALQPQSTGQIQSILQPQHTGSVLHPQQTGSGLQRPPAANLGSSAFGLSTMATGHAALPWDVTAQEKASADQFFDNLDTANKGYIEGDVAVPFFLQSQLPGDTLAQVWSVVPL